MEGLDAMPLVTEERRNLRDYIICGYNDFVCVRDEQWHYITADRRRVMYPSSEDRLFDVRSDPEMKVNAIENHPSVVKKMNKRIKALWEQYGMEYEQP